MTEMDDKEEFLAKPPKNDEPYSLGTGWLEIESAPKDGRPVRLLSHGDVVDMGGELIVRPPTEHVGEWDPEGTSWVGENGEIGCEHAHHLEVTGFWAVGDGWLQPDEVIYWKPEP